MFGLTKREQYWAAQERGFKIILDHQAKMAAAAAEVAKAAAELELERTKERNLQAALELERLKAANDAALQETP